MNDEVDWILTVTMRILPIFSDMVPFAGYELPVLYKGENGGVMKEHLWCRSEGKASLFDVSHMGQVRDGRSVGRSSIKLS